MTVIYVNDTLPELGYMSLYINNEPTKSQKILRITHNRNTMIIKRIALLRAVFVHKGNNAIDYSEQKILSKLLFDTI